MPYFDRYDIVEAHFAFATDWHGGQNSELYRKQCRILRYFNPGFHWDGYQSLTENGQAIYDELCERNGFAE